MIDCIKKMMPISFMKWQSDMRKKIYMTKIYHRFVMRGKIAKVRKKSVINVLFIAFTPSMWKVDSLYRAMRAHPRFKVEILLHPNMPMSDLSARRKDFQRLRDFFDRKGYHYVEWVDIYGNIAFTAIPDEYDIIFYPQPWEGIVHGVFSFLHNRGRLFICCLYAFHSTEQKWDYDKWYQNAAWLDLFENEETYRLSCKKKYNGGVNSVITGLPIVDEFTRGSYNSPWKHRPRPCKKIIWAPHWTINENHLICYSNFLAMANGMLQYARDNKDKMQFAFKPHPHLQRELYKHPSWGKEKTDKYYAEWENGKNTQLVYGDYVDLFMTSDAMVHDSCSFCCEYMLTGNPVLFIARNEQGQLQNLNAMARAAFFAQYIGYSMEDVEKFLEHRVFLSNDPKKEERKKIVAEYLTPPNGKNAAQNIIDAIIG